ncbi:MAG: phosphoribosyltransferase [Candidatus Bathyarchaeota archaeon]|nr:MAG: phosphoribosyltransferase [Candidatus Bathyarchaeota archaeon]
MRKEVKIDSTRYLLLDWNEIAVLINDLADRIKARCYTPNLIIGIFRGGMMVAHLLSDRLGMYNIRGIGAKLYQRTGKRDDSLDIYQPLPLKDLKAYDVLIADDVLDTGTTFRGVLESQIHPKNPRRLCTVSLHVKPWAKHKPSLYVEETNCWVRYPWESYEVARDIYKDLLETHSPEIAKKLLIEKFEFNPFVIERIANSM